VSRPIRSSRGGFALLVVLLVLIALLVLAAPFLMMARNADRASTELEDRARARLALDAAARHARVELGPSYPGADKTPYYDSLDEIRVRNEFDPAFLDPSDEKGLLWNVESRDVAGEIDLNSAPPQVFANLMGLSTRLSRAIQPEEKEVPLASTANFEPAGVVWTGGELLRYTKIENGALVRPIRGVLGPANASEWHGGPMTASAHDAGAPAIDQRAFAPALWRLAGGGTEPRVFDSKERVRESGGFVMAAADPSKPKPPAPPKTGEADEGTKVTAPHTLSEDALRPLFLHGSVHGGVRGGSVWQRAARLASPVHGGTDGILRVDNPRWFNAGSTVQITDGVNTELALVQEVRRGGEIVLDRVLQGDYAAFAALVRVLARRPVNLNTASEEVLQAIFLNLQVAGRNSRITGDEAQKLAELVLESRPFEGFEDFLRRVVLPAAGVEKLPADAPVVPSILGGLASGGGVIDPDDALALTMNGLNANDGGLLYSTMPFAFVTRDTYDLELRATVDAPSGVERCSIVREETDVVVPQRQLVALWARQEDFDEALRLDLEAPWWMTGPHATSRWDNGSVPPSRLWAELGTAEGKVFLPGVTDMSSFKDRSSPPTVEHVFPSREDTAWIHLWPSRVGGKPNQQGRVIHFDHETRDPEGRFLPDEIVSRTTSDEQVGWTTGKSPLCRPFSFSLWVKPKTLAISTLLDVGGTSHESDRASLLLDGTDLVFRLIAAGGDHPDTATKEVTETRFSIAKNNSPGLPANVWSHVEIDARGSRPDQIQMLVNGLGQGVRTPGLTRLSGSLSLGSPVVPVESVEGFPAGPDTCTIRAGNEVIEVLRDGGGMSAKRFDAGRYAGFGGRMAREPFGTLNHAMTPGNAPINLQTLLSIPQQSGSPVELYGYSTPIASVVTVGHALVQTAMIPFRAARLVGVTGGQSPQGDPLQTTFASTPPQVVFFGMGLDGIGSRANGLVLGSADGSNDPSAAATPPDQFMPAFDPQGGYAALVMANFTWSANNDPVLVDSRSMLGGIEVIRYAGYTGTTLTGIIRGDAVTPQDFQGLANPLIGGRHAFIASWNSRLSAQNSAPYYTQLQFATYVFPISMRVSGATTATQYPAARAGNPAFAQLTEIEAAERTEWVRYDWYDMATSQLVRDDPAALLAAMHAVTSTSGFTRPPPPSGGGGGNAMFAVAPPVLPPPPAPEPPQTPPTSSVWDPHIGQSENTNYPLSEAIETALQFRGVLGTFSHQHAVQTPILPVFRVDGGTVDNGRPGRLDAAFLVAANADHPGWPVRVHRAHVPGTTIGVTGWTQANPQQYAIPTRAAAERPVPTEPYLLHRTFVALQAAAPQILDVDPAPAAADPRLRTRLVCPPSGELPRLVGTMTVGGGFDGAQSGAIPAATVDEVVFGDAQFARKSPGDPDTVAGQCLILAQNLDEQGTNLVVLPRVLRLANGPTTFDYEFLGELPTDAGLLKIGDEVVCYSARDASSGRITIANGGRGLLGTRPQPHQVGDPAFFLESHPVSTLSASVGATDSTFQVASIEDFPQEGTILVDTELVHYTHIRDNVLEMPRASSVAGQMDAKGNGLFRGRYGTTPAGHTSGAPVILFPFRYWDRWQTRADAPELSYFTLAIDQPSAWWDSFFFDKEDADTCRLGVLARYDPEVPWDADPDDEPRLKLFWKGDLDNKTIPVHRQSDRIDWRVFVQYDPGAFDAKTGLAHGWKQSPLLKRFGAFYFGPATVLSSVER
jgi:type II secretory pathway pseudopilin PulG